MFSIDDEIEIELNIFYTEAEILSKLDYSEISTNVVLAAQVLLLPEVEDDGGKDTHIDKNLFLQ